MEPPNLPPDKESDTCAESIPVQQSSSSSTIATANTSLVPNPANTPSNPIQSSSSSTAITPANTMTAVSSLPTIAPNINNNQLVLYQDRNTSISSALSTSTASLPSNTSSTASTVPVAIEKLSRPMAFDKVSTFLGVTDNLT